MNGHRRPSVSRRTLLKGAAALGVTAGLTGHVAPRIGAKSARQTVNLQFWDMPWGPPEYIETAQKLVVQFNEQSEGINVTYRSVPWDNWYASFSTAIGAGEAPDLSTGSVVQAHHFYEQDAILPIDDLIEELRAEGALDDFPPATIDGLRYDDHQVALPWAIDIRVPWYRTDLFAEAGVQPPTTWDELAAAMRQLTEGDRYGMVCSGDSLGVQYLLTFMLNNGGGLFTADGKVDLLSERNVEALEFFSGLVQQGTMHPASAGYTFNDATRAFGQGTAGIFIHPPGLDDQLPDIRDKLAVLPPLAGPHGDKGTIYWVNNVMVYRQTKHPAETMAFLKWWSANQLPLWTEGHCGQFPVRTAFAADPYFVNPNGKFILEEWIPVAKSEATHSPTLFPELHAIDGDGTMQALAQELLQGKNVEEAAAKAEAGLKSIAGE